MQPDIDDARVARPHGVGTETEPVHGLRADRVDEDVGRVHQPPERLAGLLMLEVEADAALVAVADQEEGRHAGIAPRPGLARGVARGRLDLDDIGAHVAQQHGAVGAEQHGGEVEDPDAFHRRGHSPSSRRAPV